MADRIGQPGAEMLRSFVIVAAILVAVWLAFVLWVWLVRPDQTSLSDATRLLPDTLRLVRRLSTDRTLPRSTRGWVWALLVYLALPIDLVPDFLPVIGYADDAIITSFVLRHVIAKAGPAKLTEHWPGSPEGMATLTRLLRLRVES
jgi:uncharacterized membrane protein YkvA (DUF1232 family)